MEFQTERSRDRIAQLNRARALVEETRTVVLKIDGARNDLND
jgi:hypothetical protein